MRTRRAAKYHPLSTSARHSESHDEAHGPEKDPSVPSAGWNRQEEHGEYEVKESSAKQVAVTDTFKAKARRHPSTSDGPRHCGSKDEIDCGFIDPAYYSFHTTLVRAMLIATTAALLLLVGRCCLAGPSRRSCSQTATCNSGLFQGAVSLPGVTVTIEKVDHVTNGTYGEPDDKGFPQPADLLPEVCAVIVKIRNTTDAIQSDYRFGMFLPPAANWNSRTLTVGSASFAGGINWIEMGQGPHFGFATISTDNGHNSIGSDLTWATPARLLDWGYRAMHGSVLVGKLLIGHYYGKAPAYSYYSSCSTGGRQGLREIQYDEKAFDGALIGAAAWDTAHLMPWVGKVAHDLLSAPRADLLGTQQMSILAAEVLRQCDSIDGHVDRIVSSPERCNFDISQVVCSDPNTCLTAGQARTARRIYDDYVLDTGRFASHGFQLGSEDQWGVYFGNVATMQGFDFDYERWWLYNRTNYSWREFNDAVVPDSERVDPGRPTADKFDVSPYRDRGGKIVMYHGTGDGLISPKTSLQYYNATVAAADGGDLAATRRWFRYFEIPGMAHCFLSNARYGAPWDIGAGGQAAVLRSVGLGDGWSVPGHLGDPAYDALAALMRWVEDGTAVGQVIATAFNADLSTNRTRPVCPWPEKALFVGGNIDDAASWTCG
ncbi:uncharacterized protein E0L32_000783 [Thyridium curvatum]|uniref:Carboxylic ester hydrolase n=1 Tax=Thyridium curvatum TaxID=1093900 RepID=A0A507B0K7_9PEZI|nr:uncharacterized protein E0L32_000783 [Thyridium curvatum]TPX12606.1 hypothetical protein E0L32_000783 [Thyridium curvatum]